MLVEALAKTGGRRAEAAKVLGISRTTLWKRIKKYGITLE
jgi:transcriptional regulator of acetoin/glycerol metabolism